MHGMLVCKKRDFTKEERSLGTEGGEHSAGKVGSERWVCEG